MKVQCYVCSKKEASIYCTADEAALCDECDYRVHDANKLASKHQRFSLQNSSSKPPICDICQEKRALIFCQEDRAILCRECDIALHTANEFTQKHNRLFLTGLKLSSTTAISPPPPINTIRDGCDTTVPDHFKTIMNNSSSTTSSFVANNSNNNGDEFNDNCGGSNTSNISDYLIQTLPGWHFDDFILEPPSPLPFSKGNNNSVYEVNEEMASFFDMGQQMFGASENGLEHFYGNNYKHQDLSMNKARNFITDDAFTVPQITSSAPSNKRTRPF